MKKVLLMIDNLNSGGAQRQIVTLAIGLKKHNYDVSIVTYSVGDHFQAELHNHHIPHTSVYTSSSVKKFKNLLNTIIIEKPDIVCAYLFRPSLIALLLKLLYRKPDIYVSERSFENTSFDWSRTLSRVLYPLAKRIIVNSKSQLTFLKQKLPNLQHALVYIANGVDLTVFKPQEKMHIEKEALEILSIGHVNSLKNTKTLIVATSILVNEHKLPIRIRWVGRNYDRHGVVNSYYSECIQLIQKLKLDVIWSWEGKKQDLTQLYNSADIVVHPSFGEGFPNVICEALACGCPVIASNVCDHPYIIQDNVNGFLFDPHDAGNLAQLLHRFYNMSPETKKEMRINCRETAQQTFPVDKMIDAYHHLFMQSL